MGKLKRKVKSVKRKVKSVKRKVKSVKRKVKPVKRKVKSAKYKYKGGSLLASLQSNLLPISMIVLNNHLTKKNIKKFTKKFKF
jgi:histone H1/5